MKATARIRYLSAKVSVKIVLLINLSNLEFLSRIFHHIAPVHEEECCLHEVQYTPSNVKTIDNPTQNLAVAIISASSKVVY